MSEIIKNQIQIARIIFTALMAGQVFFYLFTWFIIKSSAVLFNENFSNHILYLSLPVVVFGTFFLALYVSKRRKSALINLKSEQAKAEHYRETAIMQGASVEMGGLFSIFVAFFSFSYMPLMFFALSMLMFFFLFPSEKKYSEYLK